MRILFYLLFFLFSLGQLGRITLPGGQINFYLYEPLMAIIFLVFLFRNRLDPIVVGYRKLKIVYAFDAFLVFSFITGLYGFSYDSNLVALLYLSRLIFYQVFFLYLHFDLEKTKNIRLFKEGFYLSIFLVTISSLVQYFFYPNLRNLYYLGWDPHLNRLFGVFFDTGLAAAFFGVISFYFYKRKNFFAALVFLTFLVLTFSRSAYLVFLAAISFDFMKTKNIKYMVYVLLTFFLIFYFAPKDFGEGVGLGRTFSISSRLADYGKAYKAFADRPVMGYGYNRIDAVKEKYNLKDSREIGVPDHAASSFSSSFLIIAVTSGVIGLALFLMTIFKLAMYKNMAVYFVFLSLLSLADNIILHPFVIFSLGSIAMVSLLYDK